MWRCAALCRGLGSRPAATASAPAALVCAQRTILIREYRLPITIYEDGDQKGSGVKRASPPTSGYPAVLKWQYRSSRPRHLVLSIDPPASGSVREDGLGDMNLEQFDAAGRSMSERTDGDYMFGRLFLRPYNVAQLLAVFHGWEPKGTLIDREHANLSLAPHITSRPASNTAKGARKTNALSAFLLTGSFTTKSIPVPGQDQTIGGQHDTAESGETEDVEPDSFPGSVYNTDDRRRIRVEIHDAELMLLINHLESTLRDLFTIEHRYHELDKKDSLQRQREWLQRRAPQQTNAQREPSASSSSPGGRPPQPPRTMYRSQQQQAAPPSATSPQAPSETPGADASRHEELLAAASAAIGAKAMSSLAELRGSSAVVTEEDAAADAEEFEELEEEEAEELVEQEPEEDFAETQDVNSRAVEADDEVANEVDMSQTAPKGNLEEIDLDALVGDEEADLAVDDDDAVEEAAEEVEELAEVLEETEEFEEFEELEEAPTKQAVLTDPLAPSQRTPVEDDEEDLPEVVVEQWDTKLEADQEQQAEELDESEEMEEVEEVEEIEEEKGTDKTHDGQRIAASQIFGAAVGAAGLAAAGLQGSVTSRAFGDQSGQFKVGHVKARDPVSGADIEGRYGVGDRHRKVGDVDVDEQIRIATQTTTSADKSTQSHMVGGTQTGTFRSAAGDVSGSFFVAKSTSYTVHTPQPTAVPTSDTSATPSSQSLDKDEVADSEETEEEEEAAAAVPTKQSKAKRSKAHSKKNKKRASAKGRRSSGKKGRKTK